MFGRSATRTTYSDPIRTDSVVYPRGECEIGLTICPGLKRLAGEKGAWDRDLAVDLADIAGWGASHLVTTLEAREFRDLGVEAMPEQAEDQGLCWWHLPIEPGRPPGRLFNTQWSLASRMFHFALARGEKVVFHDIDGRGRGGMVACRLLVEAGLLPDDALARVRNARPGAVEAAEQGRYVESLKALAMSRDH